MCVRATRREKLLVLLLSCCLGGFEVKKEGWVRFVNEDVPCTFQQIGENAG